MSFCIHSCFLLLLLGNPLFPLHGPSPIPLYLDKVRLSLTLTLSHLRIWCSRQTALFLLLLAKVALAYLLTALSVALKPLFPFRQAQYTQVLPLKPAPFCMLFAGLGSTKSATSLLLLSLHCLLLHLSFYLNLSGRNCLLSPPVLLDYNGSPDTRFSREKTQLMSWPDGERYSCPLQSLVVSLLSDLRRTVSSKFFNTQFPSISIEVVPALSSSLQRTQPTVKLLSL